MPTYTNLGIKKITTGDEAGTWGDSTNTNFDYFDSAIVGYVSVTMTNAYTSGAPYALNVADFAASNGRNRIVEFVGSPGVNTYVKITPNDFVGYYFVRNSVAGGFSVFVFQTDSYDSAKDVEIPNGADMIIRCDGAGSTLAVVQSVLNTPQFTSVATGNLKAADGTASATIANSTGVMTVASSVLTTTDINGGTIDSASLGASSPVAGVISRPATAQTSAFQGKESSIFDAAPNDTKMFSDSSDWNYTTITNYTSFRATPGWGTAAGSGTITTYKAFEADGPYPAFGQTITDRYGFYSNITAATGAYNFYAQSSAPNYFAGETTFGGTINATTLDTTNIEVTNIKAKDGTASATIANSTGVMTVASSVLTTTDINGGTVDGTTIGASTPAAGTFTTVNKVTITAPASSATLTIANGKTATVNNTLTLAGTDSTTMTFPEVSADVGFRNIPQNSKSADYTLLSTDSGKHIFHPAADNNARTFTIPANSSVAYAVGTAITFINYSAANVTIAINSDTMRLAGDGTTGSRTLAQYGVATAIKTSSTGWIISGTGLT